MSDEVKINVTTTADTKGADAAAASLNKVEQATQKAGAAAKDNTRETKNAGDASRDTAKKLNELGEAGEKGAAAGRNLAAALDGNVGAFAMLGTQLKAIGTIVRANPIGAIFVGLTAGLALLPTLIAKIRETGDASKEAGEKVDVFGAALKKAGDTRIEALAKALSATKDEAKGAADELERVLSLIDRVNKAKGLGEQEAVDAQRKADDLKLGLQLDGARDLAGNLRGQASATGAEAFQADARARETAALRAGLEEEKRALEIEREQLAERLRNAGPLGPELGDVQRGEEIEERIGAIDESLPTQTVIAAQQNRAALLKKQAEAAEKEAAAAEEQARALGRNVVGQRTDRSAIVDPSVAVARGLEDRARRQRLGLPVDQFTPSTAPRVEDFSRRADGVVIDGRSLAAEGTKTGKQIADEMAAVLRANNSNLVQSFRLEIQRLEQQIRNGREGK